LTLRSDRQTLVLDAGDGYGRESYDFHGKPLAVEWLRAVARFTLHNPGPARAFTLRFAITSSWPRRLFLAVNGTRVRELLVGTALWREGYTQVEWDIAAAEGPNELELSSDTPAERLPEGREVTFLLVGDVTAIAAASPEAPARHAASPSPAAVELAEWLDALPRSPAGFAQVSENRPYTFAEADYDAQYAIAPDLGRGRGLVELLRETGGDFSGPALEVGCGTGTLSLGLVAADAFPLVVLTDGSDAFLTLTRAKLTKLGIDPSRTRFVTLLGEEIDRLPEASLSLVVLRSALHHVLDVPGFLRKSARTLRPGGILSFEEPCAEGYILMGALAGFLPALAGGALSEDQNRTVKVFTDAMRFYARPDVDKTDSEDKHVFRQAELQRAGTACGLDVELLPNVTYDDCAAGLPSTRKPRSFLSFFRDYLKFCMSWNDALMALVETKLLPYCEDLELLAQQGAGPEMHGVFVCRKRG